MFRPSQRKLKSCENKLSLNLSKNYRNLGLVKIGLVLSKQTPDI